MKFTICGSSDRYYITAYSEHLNGAYYLFADGIIREWNFAVIELGLDVCIDLIYFADEFEASSVINLYKTSGIKLNKKYIYDFPKANITVDNIITKCIRNVWVSGRIYVLLVKRKNNPYKFWWALPGGFLEMDETLAQGAKRELKEETGVDADPKLFCMADRVDRDSRGRTISAVFTAIVDCDIKAIAADDAEDVLWANLDDVMIMNLAFDHKEILEKYINEYN